MVIKVYYSTWYTAEIKSGHKKTMSTSSFKIWTRRPLTREFLRSCIVNNTDKIQSCSEGRKIFWEWDKYFEVEVSDVSQFECMLHNLRYIKQNILLFTYALDT